MPTDDEKQSEYGYVGKRPLKTSARISGDVYIPRGVFVPALDNDFAWEFQPNKFGNVFTEDAQKSTRFVQDLPASQGSKDDAVEREEQVLSTLEGSEQDVPGSQCEDLIVSISHTTTTVELAGELTTLTSSVSMEKHEVLGHQQMEVTASGHESAFQSETHTQIHLVETSGSVFSSTGTMVDGKESEAFPPNSEELQHLSQDGEPAISPPSSIDLDMAKTPSDANEQDTSPETEKVPSDEPEMDQTVPPVDASSSGTQMEQQARNHTEDAQQSTQFVEDLPASEGSKDAEVDAAEEDLLQQSEETISEENLVSQVGNASEIQSTMNKDEINEQSIVDKDDINEKLEEGSTSSLANFESKSGKDGQEEDNTTASVGIMTAGTPAKGDAFKLGDSGASTTSQPTLKSDVAITENAATSLGTPISAPTVKTSQRQLNKMEKTSAKKQEEQNRSSFVAPMLNRNEIFSSGMNLTDPQKAVDTSKAVNFSDATLVSPIVVGSSSTCSLEKTPAKASKTKSERKPRRTSKSAGKETSRKGSNVKGDTTPFQLQSGGRTDAVNQSSAPSVQITQSTEKQQSLQTPALKAFGTFATPTASLPDLNSSALSNILRRPFTDMQQVQLRAQIFVYGALIQGTAPDEAYMISAFGGPDGGKGGWEKPWRACVVRAQKLHLATPETPVQRSGRIETPSASHTSSKDSSATNSIIPLSSPLWSLSTSLENLQSSSMQRGSGSAAAHQPLLSSSHAHQTPPVDPTIAALSESDNNEVHAQTCNLMQSLEVTVDAHDRDQVSKSSQILSETVVSESACYVSGGSASNLAESNSQPDNTPGDNSDVIAHLCHAWKVSCGSSPQDEEDYEEEESDDCDEESDYLSDDSEYDLLDVEGITMRTPSRSRILQLLPFDSRTQLSEFSNDVISPRLARACLGKKRFGFVCETDPIGGNLRISDSKGQTYFYWKTSGPSSEYFTEEEMGKILREAAGFIRNQWDHDLCYGYAVCDLISSCRVIHGLDDEFIPLCPRFLCQRLKPENYESEPRYVKGIPHCCYEYNMLDALRYVKENGIPREDPEDVSFSCTEKKEYDPEEDLCQITAIYKYKTLEEALERLKTHHVVAGLVCFEGYQDQDIYRGPCRKDVPARYLGEHSVVMIEYKELNGEKVIMCKSSSGVKDGFEGYIAVSVEVMLILAGARRKKGKDQTCNIKPQYLLSDFLSVDMDWDQSKKSESEQERHRELNRKFEDSY